MVMKVYIYLLNYYQLLSDCSQLSDLLVNDQIVNERFTSGEIIFQITGPEYAKRSLYKLEFDLGIVCC